VVKPVALAVLAWTLLACQEIRSIDRADGGGLIIPPSGGSAPMGGGIAPPAGGGDPPMGGSPVVPPGTGVRASVPSSAAGCAADAVPVTAQLLAGGPESPYWRADLFEIRFTAPGGTTVTVHHSGGGLVQFKDDSFLFGFQGAGPMVTGAKTLTVAATDDAGCVGTAAVQVRAVGDLVVGDDEGRVTLVANDGTVLSNLASVGRGDVTALHFLGGDLMVGVEEDASGEPAVLILDSAGREKDRLQMVRGDQRIYPDGAPSALTFDGTHYWGAGANGVVYRWDSGGFLVDGGLDVELSGATLGFARVGQPDRMVLGAAGDAELRAVNLETGAQETFARLESSAATLAGTSSGGVVAIHGSSASLLNAVGGGPPPKDIGAPWPGVVTPLGAGFVLLDRTSGRVHRYDAAFNYVGVVYSGGSGFNGTGARSVAALE
jgi:hypothetical protein